MDEELGDLARGLSPDPRASASTSATTEAATPRSSTRAMIFLAVGFVGHNIRPHLAGAAAQLRSDLDAGHYFSGSTRPERPIFRPGKHTRGNLVGPSRRVRRGIAQSRLVAQPQQPRARGSGDFEGLMESVANAAIFAATGGGAGHTRCKRRRAPAGREAHPVSRTLLRRPLVPMAMALAGPQFASKDPSRSTTRHGPRLATRITVQVGTDEGGKGTAGSVGCRSQGMKRPRRHLVHLQHHRRSEDPHDRDRGRNASGRGRRGDADGQTGVKGADRQGS